MPEDIFSSVIKPRTKRKKATFAIDENVLNEFSKLATNKDYNKSMVIENLLKIFMEQEKNKSN
ncbi:MAG: hypothetical protein RBR02_09640 [Desulfuromonadaceae bacterium]|nr:hypothetical protein [Desulfuromonadaceae bacterium]